MNALRLALVLDIVENAVRVGPGSVKLHPPTEILSKYQSQKLHRYHRGRKVSRISNLPCLHTLRLQCRESRVQISCLPIHRRNSEGSRVKERKREINMGEPIQIQILWSNALTLSSVRPRLVVAD